MQDKLGDLIRYIIPRDHSLRILVLMNSVLVFIVGLIAPFYVVFAQKIGGSIAFAGMSWAIYLIVGGVLTLLFSNWGLKVKEQELLIALGYILRGGVFLSYAFMTSIPQLVITQIFWGVATAFGSPAFDAVFASHTTKSRSISQWGKWEGISSIVTGLAALTGGLLIQAFGYQIIFIAMAIASISLGIYTWRLPREVL